MNEKATVRYKAYKDGELLVPVGGQDGHYGEFPLDPILVLWKSAKDIKFFLPPGADTSLEGIAKRLIQKEYQNLGDVEVVIMGAECKACNTFLTIEDLEYDGMCFDCWLDEGQPDRWVSLRDNYGNELFKLVEFDQDDQMVCCKEATADEIIRDVGTDDLHNFRIKAYRIRIAKDTMDVKLTPIKIHGTWHDAKNPLYIKGTIDGGIVFNGWGTDH